MIHQGLIFTPGPFPVTHPDSGTYLAWNPQRTPIYPFFLEILGSIQIAAIVQVVLFAFSAALFFLCSQIIIRQTTKNQSKSDYLIWGVSLYYALNFELIQFAPAILTESLGISLFVCGLYSALLVLKNPQSRLPLVYLTFVFPLSLTMTRPSFVLVPLALLGFIILWAWKEKNKVIGITALVGVIFYGLAIQSYAIWNKSRLGHVGLSDIAQHQIFANFQVRGYLAQEGEKIEASERLKSFYKAYLEMNPGLRDSQYSLFEVWQKNNPDKILYDELIIVNKELLAKRPLGYLYISLRNLYSLIDGRASFNYYQIENRDLPSKIYFRLQELLDHLFALLWFIALFFFLRDIKKREFFCLENFLFLLVTTQFLTISIVGYSELRRQSIGVASAQMLFVFLIWKPRILKLNIFKP